MLYDFLFAIIPVGKYDWFWLFLEIFFKSEFKRLPYSCDHIFWQTPTTLQYMARSSIDIIFGYISYKI